MNIPLPTQVEEQIAQWPVDGVQLKNGLDASTLVRRPDGTYVIPSDHVPRSVSCLYFCLAGHVDNYQAHAPIGVQSFVLPGTNRGQVRAHEDVRPHGQPQMDNRPRVHFDTGPNVDNRPHEENMDQDDDL